MELLQASFDYLAIALASDGRVAGAELDKLGAFLKQHDGRVNFSPADEIRKLAALDENGVIEHLALVVDEVAKADEGFRKALIGSARALMEADGALGEEEKNILAYAANIWNVDAGL